MYDSLCHLFAVDRTPPNDTGRTDDADLLATNGITFDWDESKQQFNIPTCQEKNITVEVVQQSTKKMGVHKLLRKAKVQEVSDTCMCG